jgi:hypothetical protein
VPDRVSVESPCPDLADLLLASEGELPRKRQAEVVLHLRRCAACREQLGNVGLAMREYQDAMPAPSAAATDAATVRQDLFRTRVQQEQRVHRIRNSRLAIGRWLPVAAAVPVLVGALFFSNHYSSVVRAEELLTRAEAIQHSVPTGTVRRLQIHVRRATARARTAPSGKTDGRTPATASNTARSDQPEQWSFTREVGGWTPSADGHDSTALIHTVAASPAVSASPDEEAELSQILDASHFDWRDPLSVRGFRAWRASLADKTESVTPISSDALALRTQTSDGALRSAELIVRRADFQPLRQTLQVDGFGEVEIIELSRWVAPVVPVVEHRSAAIVPTVESPAPNAEILDEAELDVRVALRDAAVDWNPAIAITRAGHAIEVRGVVDPRHKAEIARALNKITPVRVALRVGPETSGDQSAASADSLLASSPHEAGGTAARESTPPAVSPSPAPLTRWLERTFGGDERATAFLAALDADVEQVRHRTGAFARLAVRYSEAETSRLNVPARQKLDALALAQYGDVVKAVEAVDDRLALFLGTTTRRTLPESVPQPWQAWAVMMSPRAQRLAHAIHEVAHDQDLPLPTELRAGQAEPPALLNLRQAADALWEQ